MKKLTDEQMELLFLNFLNTPTDEEYKLNYRRSEKESGLSDKDIKEMGYSSDETKEIKESVKKAMN